MPLTVRLSEDAEAVIEEWVEEGKFKSKSEAVREALNVYERYRVLKREGYHILAISDKSLAKLEENSDLAFGLEIA